MFDPELFGQAMGEAIRKAVEPLQAEIAELKKALADKGEGGVGMAGAMIDRDGCLQITLSNGELKNLGGVVGKDGISFDSFELEYIAETHEICVKAQAGGRVKELRYPAGGIQPGGYWREGVKSAVNQAWVHDGSLWIAVKSTTAQPSLTSEDWIIAARRGRDGERGQKGAPYVAPEPIKLEAVSRG